MADDTNGDLAVNDEGELDLDYSQTHLDDFLKSQTNNSLLKGSQIQSGQLLTSFLSTYNKMRGTGSLNVTGTSGTVDASKGQNTM
jgi:hypothetical protein